MWRNYGNGIYKVVMADGSDEDTRIGVKGPEKQWG